MPTYRVVYEIDVEEETPEAAAREAYACMRDPESMPPAFDVIPWTDNVPPDFTCDMPGVITVDLNELGTP